MICEYHLHVPYTYIMGNICSSLVQVSADEIVLLCCAETWKRFMSTMCLVVFFTLLTGLSLSLHGNTHTHTHTHTTDGYVARLQAALNSTGLPQDQPLRTQSANVHKAAPQPYIMYTLEFTIMSQFLFLQLISTDFNCPPLNGIKPATDNGMYTYTITIYGIALCVKVIIGCVPHAWISETDMKPAEPPKCFLVWDTCSSPHFPVTPAQLMRSGFGKIYPAQWVTLRNSTLGLPFFSRRCG